MKIVLLDTGRGVNPDTIRMWRENLQLSDDDTVALMAWQPPREPLPVTEHYVFGPRLDLRNTEPRHVQTQGDIIGGHDIDAASLAAAADDAATGTTDGDADDADDADDAEIGGEDSPMSESDLAGQLPEAVADTGDHSAHWESSEYGDDEEDAASDAARDDAGSGNDDSEDDSGRAKVGPAGMSATVDSPVAATQGAPDPVIAPTGTSGTTGSTTVRTNAAHLKVAHLPRTDPARLKHALTWRVKKLEKTGKRALGSAKRRLKTGSNPIAKAAQQALATRNGSISTQFAIALARSSEAAALFREADLVFPVDARSQRGAWLLARANEGPDVMVGYPAAIRALDRRRAKASP